MIQNDDTRPRTTDALVWIGAIAIVLSIATLAGVHGLVPLELLLSMGSIAGLVTGVLLINSAFMTLRLHRIEQRVRSTEQHLVAEHLADESETVTRLDRRRF